MWRYLAGIGAVLLLGLAGAFYWYQGSPFENMANQVGVVPPPIVPQADKLPGLPPATDSNLTADDFPELPQATAKTKEEKRFDRYDKNHNNHIDLAEFLAATRKAFDKVDVNQDGKLSFDEYGAKRAALFHRADANHDGLLTPEEFANTRIKSKALTACIKVGQGDDYSADGEKEQRRFARYDHNKDGVVDLAEFITDTHRRFDKLDINHDGLVSFEEYAARRVEKFRDADANGDNILTREEFATTAITRHTTNRKSPCGAPAHKEALEGED